MKPTRTLVLWFGVPPTDEQRRAFEERGLVIEPATTPAAARPLIPKALAVIFSIDDRNDSALSLLVSTSKDVVDRGAKCVLICASDKTFAAVDQALWDKYGKAHRVPVPVLKKLRDQPAFTIAQEVLEHEPGPEAKDDLAIQPRLETFLKPESVPHVRLLLQRAFGDCESIQIEPLSGSLAGANVFKVLATLKAIRLVKRPLPYYAKIATLAKITKELSKYSDFVESGVPFNLRPNPDLSRSITSGQSHVMGIIVGNFVENSEALWEVAVRGHAAAAIYCLFDHALRGWRLNARTEEAIGIVSECERSKIPVTPEDISSVRADMAAQQGATRSPKQIFDALKALPPRPHRISVIHGDLHVDNIRVRGSDAVLIDFYAVNPSAPMALDAASFEASLVFAKYGAKDNDREWMKTVDTLYEQRHFERPPATADQQDDREWLWNCVRQVRMMALAAEASPFEYETAMVLMLLRRASNSATERYTDLRAAYGLVIADRLVTKLQERIR